MNLYDLKEAGITVTDIKTRGSGKKSLVSQLLKAASAGALAAVLFDAVLRVFGL